MADSWHEPLEEAFRLNESEDYAGARLCARSALERLVAAHGLEASRHMSRLFANAVYEYVREVVGSRFYKCPRCEVEIMEWINGDEDPVNSALSRTSRSDDDAPLLICPACGTREASSALFANPDKPGKWRTGAGTSAPETWPLSVDELLAEDRRRYEFGRRSVLQEIALDELADDEPQP